MKSGLKSHELPHTLYPSVGSKTSSVTPFYGQTKGTKVPETQSTWMVGLTFLALGIALQLP